MMNDAEIRRLMIQAIPALDPQKLDVSLMDYDAVAGYWYRGDMGTLHGRAIAVNRPEKDIAADLAQDLSSLIIGDRLEISPYEGKAGRHPDNCTCSKHLKDTVGQA
jgi:hypothetical protein